MTSAISDGYTPPVVQLSMEHQGLCIKTLKFLHDLSSEIQKLEAAGIDVTTWEQLRNRLIEINQAIAKNYCQGYTKPPI